MAKLPIGTLCLIVRDTRAAHLSGQTCTVTSHIDGPAADRAGDHVVELASGAMHVTHRTCLKPLLPPGCVVDAPLFAEAA